MIKNYFKIAWRNILKDSQFIILNLVGLATGLACALLIYLWVNDELHIDKFNKNDRQLFQVLQNIPNDDGTVSTIDATPALLSRAMVEKMPEVLDAASVIPPSWFSSKGLISFGDSHIKASEQYVTANFFNVFSYDLLYGNKDQVLADRSSIVISDELAMKLFHTTQDIIGKTITWDHIDSGTDFKGLFTVSGIFKKCPLNSTAQFDLLLPYDAFLAKRPNAVNWGNSDPSTYVVLKPGTNVKKFGDKISNFYKETNKALYGSNNLKWIGTLLLQRYSDRYLYNRYENGMQAGGRIEYIKLFSTVALFILLIACINFMNLSTAKASKRLKEVGIRKCLGANRFSLIFQYLGESLHLTILALLLALALVMLLLPTFNAITGKDLGLYFDASLILSVSGITFLTAIVAGSYPAFYLSAFNPIIMLRGKLHGSFGELWVRKGLVVFQFTLSVIFIVLVLVVSRQMKFIQTRNLGYDKDNVISFKREGKLNGNVETFLNEAKKIPGVINASSFAHNLTGDHGTLSLEWEGKVAGQGVEFANMEIDYGLMEILSFKMLEGRTFSDKFGSDNSKVIFNESAIAAMGLKNPLGKTVTIFGEQKQIIGVVKDFNFESLHEKIKPCVLQYFPNGNNILVKIKGVIAKETLAELGRLYKTFNAGLPFEYTFLDDDYRHMYVSDQRVEVLSGYFAGIAIIISCLGLFGLAAFTAQGRQKEIGIRKVVGASESNMVVMLSADFLKLVFVAFFMALPVSWWVTSEWLLNFAYRTELRWWIFAVTGIAVFVITTITVSFQAIKAALANPVEALRYE